MDGFLFQLMRNGMTRRGVKGQLKLFITKLHLLLIIIIFTNNPASKLRKKVYAFTPDILVPLVSLYLMNNRVYVYHACQQHIPSKKPLQPKTTIAPTI